jgi:hypothetical protein
MEKMEGKLIKVDDIYRLLREDNLIIGTTDKEYQKAFSDHCYLISLKNCKPIEMGFDLDELAGTHAEKVNEETLESSYNELFDAYEAGFQKAVELLGDKKFSEEDLRKALHRLATSFQRGYNWDKDADFQEADTIIKSLQQTEWDVEIEMEPYHDGNFVGDGKTHVFEPKWRPKLDSEGCLILKRKV